MEKKKSNETEITMDMLRAGYEAFGDWDEEEDEPGTMLVAVFDAMTTARKSLR